MKRQTITLLFSDPIQINGLKWFDDHSEVSLQHLKALDRRTINLMGEVTAKTFPIRIKKECIFNVSTSSIYEFRLAVMVRYYENNFIGHLFQLPTFMNAIVNLFLMLLPKKMSERFINVGSDETKLVPIAQFQYSELTGR